MASRSTGSFEPAHEDAIAGAPTAGVDAGRLGVYAALGASTGAVPLPWLPELLAARVRGALVHDVATRHGVSLSAEARAALADPLAAGARRGLAANALRFFGAKIAVRAMTRLGPAGLLWPLSGALRTYALGRLFDRYLERHRAVRAARIDADEARRVRKAIDAALMHALRASPAAEPAPPVIDDRRDPVTAVLDSLLGFAAGLPSRFVRHIDAAFDEMLNDVRE
jgi:hypothetical protein